jgi:hypothetical protein
MLRRQRPANEESVMEDPEHDEPEAAEDVEDLELEPGDVEDVKGGTGPRDAASGLPTGQR